MTTLTLLKAAALDDVTSHLNALAAQEALALAGVLVRERDTMRRRVLAQGVVTLANDNIIDGWLSSAPPTATVALDDALPSADYAVDLDVEAADDTSRVGQVVAYDKALNGFKIRITGSADNVVVRWTLLNPLYQ